MRRICSTSILVVILLSGLFHAGRWVVISGAAPHATVRTDDPAALQADLKVLEQKLSALRALKPIAGDPPARARLADAELFHKGVVWALRYERTFSAADMALMRRAIARGIDRADALLAGRAPWTLARGRVVRGFVSAVDGSVQPYGLVVPRGYDPSKPIRLDVVLHGSTHPTGMSELRFIAPFDGGDEEAPSRSDAGDSAFIELHPLGRVENGYRWAGETDVFEAIEDVCRNYNIDRRRVVLRGMSMGASGTWHLGLKHPDRFVALGPYCGYVDTHRFSETPGMNFVKVGALPAHQEACLHMLDSADYAANAGVVPAIAAIGDRDPFFQAHVIMGAAMRREGLDMVNLISPGTGHVQDPTTFGEQMRQIAEIAARGLDPTPKRLRFVTWTLKYSRCHWIEVLGLREHYARAEIAATVSDDGTVDVAEPTNVTRFAVLPPMLQGNSPHLRIGGQEIRLPYRQAGDAARGFVVEHRNGRWMCTGMLDSVRLSGKRPGLQGPIDDAFTTPFLCVRGTGSPWNPAVQAWSEANLKRFAYEWNRYFRGDLPLKDDSAVTREDLRQYNLILFGDPGSNRWIRKALPGLPIGWTRAELRVGTQRYSTADHGISLICASPFGRRAGAPGHYLVLNSGHSFHEAELNTLNYLLFPRLGDWAVIRFGGPMPSHPSGPLDEKVIQAGFFDEQWKLARPEHSH